MRKEKTIQRWKSLPSNMPIAKHMQAIPYKSKGSSYGACGIRIDGSPEFIDAVLSNLKELISLESVRTRLELSRQEVDGSKLGKSFSKAVNHAEVCYIRCHQRGNEGAILKAYEMACS